jgi:enoyl-CoA hydratase/carnithine racemase
MKEKLEQLKAMLKANKATVIRVAGVAIGALVGVAVAAVVVNAQENAEFENDEQLLLDEEESVEETE